MKKQQLISVETPTPTSPAPVAQIKQSNIINAKRTEIDENLLRRIYNLQEKEKPSYTIIEKKTIFDKEITKNLNYNEKNDSYYSNYLYFREYLMTGYTYEYTVNEIEKIKSLLQFSKQLRSDISKHFDIKTEPETNNDTISSMTPKIAIQSNILQNYPTKNTNKRLSSVFSTVRYANNFVKICKLLKLKNQKKDDNNDNYQFRLYSQFEKESDVFSIPQFVNFTSVKHFNQNRKLTKMYHTENMFVDCVKNIKKRLKQNEPQVNKVIEIKKNLHVPSVQALFHGRDIDYFKKIDNFVNMYKENFFQIKNREKDLFNGIYNILTKCQNNCSNFLSYLYTKSYMFKYIYDIFTIEAKLNFIDKANVQIIPKENANEPFLNDSTRQLFLENTNPFANNNIDNKTVIEHRESYPVNKITNGLDNFEQIFGCLFLDKVAFLNENLSTITDDDQFDRYLDEVKHLKFDCFLLFSRDYECFVFKSAFVLPGTRSYFIEEKVSKIALYFFDPDDYSDYYYGLDRKKEKIFILKIKSENRIKEKIYLMRIKYDSFEKLQIINNDFRIIMKFNDEVFGGNNFNNFNDNTNINSPVKFDNTNEILNLNNLNTAHNVSLSKRNSMNSNNDLFQSYNKLSDSNLLGKEDKNVSSDYSKHDNLSLSRGHF